MANKYVSEQVSKSNLPSFCGVGPQEGRDLGSVCLGWMHISSGCEFEILSCCKIVLRISVARTHKKS
jgi:hypothetical protein